MAQLLRSRLHHARRQRGRNRDYLASPWRSGRSGVATSARHCLRSQRRHRRGGARGIGSSDPQAARHLYRGCARWIGGARNRRRGRHQANHQASRSVDAAGPTADEVTPRRALPPRSSTWRPSMLRAAVIFAAALAAAVTATAGKDAAAELLSSRPITVIIPFTPGASSDTLQRIVDKKFSENTGQTLVVESRPG